MVYNLDEFKTNDTKKISVDNDTGSVSVSNNTMLGTAWEAIKAAIRYKVTKLALFFIFTVAVMLITGDFGKSKNIANDMSQKGANEDYIGLFGVFAKETGHKSTKLNMHPFYHTKGVRTLEAKYKVDFGREIKFSKVMAYVKYDDQDYISMKTQARGTDNEKLKLEYSTIFGMSASDFCEDYFDGFVPDEEMRAQVVRSTRVRKIKDELTEDNDDGVKMFRCIIDPDVIEDYLEEDADE